MVRRRGRTAAAFVTGVVAALLAGAGAGAGQAGTVPADAQVSSLPAVNAHVPAVVGRIDPVHSRIGFQIRTLLGQRIAGAFPRFEGEVEPQADGRHRVHLRLYAAQAEIPNHPRYSEWLRGPQFFDAARFPLVEFDSDPYPSSVSASGGAITGQLSLRGTRLPETLSIQPAGCDRPGYDCDVVGRGVLSRGRYGMGGWDVMLKDRVVLEMHVRLDGRAPSP